MIGVFEVFESSGSFESFKRRKVSEFLGFKTKVQRRKISDFHVKSFAPTERNR